MSHNFPKMNNQALESQALNKPPYTLHYQQYDSEDPHLAEEAQLLLSRFMKKSSQESQGKNCKTSGTVARSDTSLLSEGATKDEIKSVNGWEANFILDSRPGPSRDQRNDTHAPTVWQQHSSGLHPIVATSQSFSDDASNSKPSSKVSLHHRHEPRASSTSDYLIGETSKGHPSSNARVVIPSASERTTSSQKNIRLNSPTPSAAKGSSSINATKLKSPGREMSKATMARRPRRTNGPVNYYAKIKLYDYESDTDTDDSRAAGNSDDPPSCSRRQSPGPDVLRQCFIVYSSSDVQIVEKFFNSLDDYSHLTHACYAPEHSPAGYAKKFRKKPTQRVLHVDFNQQEITAVLNLLSFYGFQWAFSPDVSLTDQVIRVVASMSTKEALTRFASKVSSMCELSRLLSNNRANDVESFLLTIMKSDGKSNKLRRVQCLIADILELQVQHGQNGLSRYVGSEKFHRLLNCLTYAPKLKRRHRADIEGFLSDARNGHLATIPCYVQGILVKDDSRSPSQGTAQRPANINRLLRFRELGNRVNQRVQTNISRNLKLSTSWKGASNDVIVLTWSPDGTRFAVGAAAQCDEHNMEYNRGKNLLLGDLTKNSLKELPDHWIPRSSQRAASSQASMSPRLYMSVTAVQWFEDTLFTASYDNTVKLWDVSSHNDAFCFKTLRHQSKVQVMARSNFNKNILATGTNSVGFWDLYEKEPTYTPLELIRFKKDIELVPTSLAWGTNAVTKNILIAGMSERDPEDANVPQNGYLGMWHANESSITPVQLSPNSQNIFDIKWHPLLPAFATASSAPHCKTPGTARHTKSVVRIYEPLTSKRCTVEFDCPAIDINDVTFCPRNPNYVTASCTDGVTYVWDYRNPSEILHRLRHDAPLNQIDENLTREQADVGVRVALWGDTIDQFYTGASDGVLKLWNILLSPEDVLIENRVTFTEEIMSGAFSEDKSNLLIGDSAGGIHVLSSGAFLHTDDHCMNFERAVELGHDNKLGPNSESGVEAARKSLSSGQLVRHPIYGVGQGPYYDGPFAAWARPKGTPKDALPVTPLEEEHRMRQLDGAPVKDRQGLDSQSRRDLAAHIRLARIRNQQRNEHKRKRDEPSTPNTVARDRDNYINLCSDDEGYSRPSLSTKSKRRPHGRVIARVKPEVIDLTGDTDSEDAVRPFAKETGYKIQPCTEQTLSDHSHEDWEEDFWWPASADVDANIQDVDV